MIVPDLLIYTPKGLYCAVGDFFIDPKKPVHATVISHAHADHAIAGHDEVHCTSPTAAIMKERYANRSGKKFFIHPSDHSFIINGVKIKFIPAGHMLGSVQVLLEYESIRYLYTGDFKLQPDETCQAFQFTEADVLITECTFAEKDFSHPDPESEMEKINSLSKPLVIGAYALGKAQRLTQLISRSCPQKEIFIHRKIYPFHKIYEQHNIKLGNWKPYSSRLFTQLKQSIYIVPPAFLSSFYYNHNHCTAFASGWNHLQNKCDMKLLISDHADWNDLLLLIKKTKPKKIMTLHGNGNTLKKHFTDSAIEVQILN